MTDKPTGLVEALARIQATMPVVHKGETAEVPTKNGGKYSYSYADLSDVAKAVYPILGSVGLAFIAMPTFRDDGRYVLLGELAHESGESRTGEFMLPDRGTAQEVGSAISYGRRYLLGCLTGIVTGDQDDDGQKASAARSAPRAVRTEPAAPSDEPSVARAELGALCKERGWSTGDVALTFTGWDSEHRELPQADAVTVREFTGKLRTGEVAPEAAA